MSDPHSSGSSEMPPLGREEIGDRLHFRPPKQGRSRDTLDRIASAALELIEEVGVEGATVAAIVERAQTSVGSFYARFPGKGDLVRHLRDQVWSRARERWDGALAEEAWGGLSMARVVEGVVGILLRSLEADFHRRRVLGRERTSDPSPSPHVLSFHDHILETVTPLLLNRRVEITHPDPEFAVRFGYTAVVGAIRELIERDEFQGAPSNEAGGDSGFATLGPELARLWTGYLQPGSDFRAGSEDGEVDFFDPWG